MLDWIADVIRDRAVHGPLGQDPKKGPIRALTHRQACCTMGSVNDTTTLTVTIDAHSEVLNETMTLMIPAYFNDTLADIVADKRTVYGPNWSRAIVEGLADLSRHCRHGNMEAADRLVQLLTMRHWEHVAAEARTDMAHARGEA